jgi:hypothetical protein
MLTALTEWFRTVDHEAHETRFWNLSSFIHMRHLHAFIPSFAESKLLVDYYTFDMPNFDVGNIHIDPEGNICGVVDWTGINIIPAHLAIRLPNSLQTSWFSTERQSSSSGLQNYIILRYCLDLEIGRALKAAGLLKGVDSNDTPEMNTIWRAGSRAKDFERLLSRFVGEHATTMLEWRAYLHYAEASWVSDFQHAKTFKDTVKTRALKRIIEQKWVGLRMTYPQLCVTPRIPRYDKIVRWGASTSYFYDECSEEQRSNLSNDPTSPGIVHRFANALTAELRKPVRVMVKLKGKM